MSMTLRVVLLGSLAALLLPMPAAQADETLVITTTLHGPRLDTDLAQATPELRAQYALGGIAPTTTMTLYVSGHKERLDIGNWTRILDADAGTDVMIDRQAHTVATHPYDAKLWKAPTTDPALTVSDTGKTAMLLGHTVRRSHLTLHDAASGLSAEGDILAAPDLVSPDTFLISGSPVTRILNRFGSRSGLPLQMTVQASQGPMGTVTATFTTTSLSTDPLPASTFAIPTGDKSTK